MYQRTMIADLPDVDDFVGVGDSPAPSQNPNRKQFEATGIPKGMNIGKFVRNNQVMHPDSGMDRERQEAPEYAEEEPDYPPPQAPQPFYNPQQFNCIDIANHIHDCPICSKFYDNDKTMYIITIVVLAIICLLLMKRILNV